VPFTGLGIGLARSALFARFHGGGVTLLSQPGGGVDALAWFDKTGNGSLDVVPGVNAKQ
jgi:hypothetical protein